MTTIKINGKEVEVTDAVAAEFERLQKSDIDFEELKKKRKKEEDEKAAKEAAARDSKPDGAPEPKKVETTDGQTIDLEAYRKQVVAEVVEGLRADRSTEERKDAARKSLEADAKPMLPQSYSFDGKTDDQIRIDAIVATNKDLKIRAEAAKGEKLVGMFEMAQLSKPVERKPLGDAGSGKPTDKERDIFQAREDKARELFFAKKVAGVEAMRHAEMKTVGNK